MNYFCSILFDHNFLGMVKATTAPGTNGVFRLMDLPGGKQNRVPTSCLHANISLELRNNIYAFCNNDSVVDVSYPRNQRSKPGVDRSRHQFLGLTHVSKKIRQEFILIYRANNRIRVGVREIHSYIAQVVMKSEEMILGVK
jgi:hypothetical protein